nr:asparagine synthase-related protein [Novosphingobium hassiacum]
MHRVPSGTCEIHDPSGIRRRRFWSIGEVPEVRFATDSEYVEALDDLFEEAVRETMHGASTPAILLSGGFDSQAVASYAVGNLGDGTPLRSFTSIPMAGHITPDRPHVFGDESDHVRALCAMYPRIEPHFVDAADYTYGERQARHLLVGGWPALNESNVHWVHAAMERASGLGCDVLLTGNYGNAGFSYDGLTGYPDWLRSGQWARLLREIGKSPDERPFWRKLLSMAVMPHVPLAWRRRIDRHRRWRASPFTDWCSMREHYARQSGALARADAIGADIDFYDVRSSAEWRRSVAESLASLTPEIDLGFRLLYGLPSRDPTAYPPLLAFCAGVPDEQYLRDGQSRWLARRLLKGRVPDMVWQEERAGAQSLDWPVRFSRDRERLLGDLTAMKDDPRLADVFDLDRMIATLAEWDGTDHPASRSGTRINSGIGRGMAMARFVSFVEGRNVG